ncbi:MAG: hypothetical protein GKR89_10355 [Candidatus Latescibacteria bacterium]|nr:hypothetical protein [Candidatus Latescibacterota bacterium]
MIRAKIALGVGGLLIGLLLGEGLVWLVAPQVHRRPHVWQFDADLGWGHIPGASGRFVAPEFTVDLVINADGLRDREFPRQKPPGRWRLLALGDSFIEGWGVNLQSSVSKQLENRLQAAGETAEVINGGVAGYGTDQELLFFEKVGQRFGPDLVLLFFYGNDLWNNVQARGIGSERGYKPLFRLDPRGQLQLGGVPVRKHPFWDEARRAARPWHIRLGAYMYEHWHLYVLIYKALAEEVPRGTQQDFYGGLYGDSKRYEPVWAQSEALLALFKKRVERTGAQLLVVYIPSIVQIEEEDWSSKRQLHGLVGQFDLQKPNRLLGAITARQGIDFVDLYQPFKEAAKERVLYYRDSHWNEAGHALAGQVLGDYLQAQRTP